MPFGLMGAVLDFNRVSGALVALSRRWFGVPVLGSKDDFNVTELRASALSAAASLRDAAAW